MLSLLLRGLDLDLARQQSWPGEAASPLELQQGRVPLFKVNVHGDWKHAEYMASRLVARAAAD